MLKRSFLDGKTLPLVVEPEGDAGRGAGVESAAGLFLDERGRLQDELLRCGALLLRGLPPSGAREFAEFVRRFSGGELLDYAGGVSPRCKLGAGVYTSTEYPRNYTLSLHNELSYTYRWPARLYFCCVTAPDEGGETPLGDSRALLRAIDPEVVRRFEGKKIRYERNLSGDRDSAYSWQAAFETEDPSAVEDYCRAGGLRLCWKDDGGLRLSEVRPATATHPATGERVWFNQADGFHPSALDAETYAALTSGEGEDGLRLNAHFGDGEPLDRGALEHVRGVMRRETVLVPWRAGDILVVDNMLAAHGRMPFTGPRKILLAMT